MSDRGGSPSHSHSDLATEAVDGPLRCGCAGFAKETMRSLHLSKVQPNGSCGISSCVWQPSVENKDNNKAASQPGITYISRRSSQRFLSVTTFTCFTP